MFHYIVVINGTCADRYDFSTNPNLEHRYELNVLIFMLLRLIDAEIQIKCSLNDSDKHVHTYIYTCICIRTCMCICDCICI